MNHMRERRYRIRKPNENMSASTSFGLISTGFMKKEVTYRLENEHRYLTEAREK